MWVNFVENLKIFGIAFLGIFLILFFRLLLKTKQTLKYFLLNILSGIWAFAVVNLTSFLFNMNIPLNLMTICSVSLGGVPWCIALIVIKVFIF